MPGVTTLLLHATQAQEILVARGCRYARYRGCIAWILPNNIHLLVHAAASCAFRVVVCHQPSHRGAVRSGTRSCFRHPNQSACLSDCLALYRGHRYQPSLDGALGSKLRCPHSKSNARAHFAHLVRLGPGQAQVHAGLACLKAAKTDWSELL